MPSFRARLFVFVLKNRHLLQFRRKRTTAVDAETSIPHLREQVEKGAGFFGKLPAGFRLEPVQIGRLHAEWMLPPGAMKDRVILYFHGGGLVVGSIQAHRGIVAKFVQASGIPALVFDYSLAPEHPWPAALEDAISAHHYLLNLGINPASIFFTGDSGGGTLCLATLLALKDKKIPLPAAAALLSPWTDLTNSGPSWETNARLDTLSWKEAQTVFARYYTGDNDPTHPWISPLFGDLHGLPPLSLHAGGHETLLSDSTRFAEKARQAGVQVSLTVGEGLFHCYPACAPMFPEATQALAEICQFLRSHCKRTASPQ